MKFSAVLMAGGKSRRMGHDKANILIHGIKLWERQLKVLRDVSPEELFVSGFVRNNWKDIGFPIVPDGEAKVGPLGGIVSSLQYCSQPFLLVLAIDMPQMSPKFLRSLVELCVAGKGVICKSDAFEPLSAIYPKECLKIAQDCLKEGKLALQGFVLRCISAGLLQERQISSEEKTLFLNVNRPEDLSFARKIEHQ